MPLAPRLVPTVVTYQSRPQNPSSRNGHCSAPHLGTFNLTLPTNTPSTIRDPNIAISPTHFPRMDECIGSTSTVSQIQPGVLLKTPRETDHNESAKSIKVAFYVEPLVLERLGSHPRIVRYVSRRDDRRCLLNSLLQGI